MNISVEVKGLKELEDALAELPKQIVKQSFKQALIAAAKTEIAVAKSLAPVMSKPTKYREPGELRNSIDVSSVKFNRYGAGVKVGPKRIKGESNQTPGAWGLMVEYGSVHNPNPVPYLRPAFDQTKETAIQEFADVLRAKIDELRARQ
jgi:HK97 gp10 family phage protein